MVSSLSSNHETILQIVTKDNKTADHMPDTFFSNITPHGMLTKTL